MSYQVGDTYRATVTIRDDAGALADPASLVLKVRAPSGLLTTVTYPAAGIVRVSLGVYYGDVALIAAGEWVVQWAAPGQVEGAIVYADVAPVDRVSVPGRPPVSQVAAILRARTRGPGRDATVAGEHGTFDTTTRPTAAQVEELITLGMGEVESALMGRAPCTTGLLTASATSVAIWAAWHVEIGYFPEQTNGDQTAAKELRLDWEGSIKRLSMAVTARCPLTVGENPGGATGSGYPIGRVPLRVPTTWQTQW